MATVLASMMVYSRSASAAQAGPAMAVVGCSAFVLGRYVGAPNTSAPCHPRASEILASSTRKDRWAGSVKGSLCVASRRHASARWGRTGGSSCVQYWVSGFVLYRRSAVVAVWMHALSLIALKSNPSLAYHAAVHRPLATRTRLWRKSRTVRSRSSRKVISMVAWKLWQG